MREISRATGLACNTVKKYLRAQLRKAGQLEQARAPRRDGGHWLGAEATKIADTEAHFEQIHTHLLLTKSVHQNSMGNSDQTSAEFNNFGGEFVNSLVVGKEHLSAEAVQEFGVFQAVHHRPLDLGQV